MNYAPVTVLVVIVAVGLWWMLSAKHHFTGPIRQVRTDDTGRVIDEGEIAGGDSSNDPREPGQPGTPGT